MIGGRGFSLVEVTIATALMLALLAAVFSLTRSSQSMSAAQGEAGDLQQRMRVGVDRVTHHLMVAGAGTYVAGLAGPLSASIPAVMPFRRGTAGSDPPGTFSTDAVTVVYVPATAAQTTLAGNVAPGAQTLPVARVPVCEAGVNLCGFSVGGTILVFDAAGAFEIMALAAIVDSASQLVTATPLSEPFGTGAGVTAVEVHTYTRKTDPMTRISQLVESTGASIDVPVLDHVVGLTFDYDVPAADLVDGPWRPDAASDLRWDADLLRIRTVGVTIRLESALLMSRGPAGALFANGGTARDPRAWVPDQTIRFQIAPRNLPLRRAE